MIVNEIYDETEPDEIEHIDIFREALLPYLSDDAVVNIEYLGNRYDISITEGRFAGVSFLGYYHSDSISIELKSHQAFCKLFELFPQSTPIDYERVNHNIQRFKFLYAFVFGHTLAVKDVKSMEDMKHSYTYDGPNYDHAVIVVDNRSYRFSIYFNLYIDTNPIKLLDNVRYSYSPVKTNSQQVSVNHANYNDFEADFIKKFITSKLDIDKQDITLEHAKVLSMLNI